jgi:hypothetical protein
MSEGKTPVKINWIAICITAGLLVLLLGVLNFLFVGDSVDDSSKLGTEFAANSGKLVYAEGFTHEKFRQVSLGMTKQEVQRLLGKPIGRSEGPPDLPGKFPEIWYYSWAGGSDPIPERQHFVEFNNKSKVIGMAWPWR